MLGWRDSNKVGRGEMRWRDCSRGGGDWISVVVVMVMVMVVRWVVGDWA